jgi:hypothetical protein
MSKIRIVEEVQDTEGTMWKKTKVAPRIIFRLYVGDWMAYQASTLDDVVTSWVAGGRGLRWNVRSLQRNDLD